MNAFLFFWLFLKASLFSFGGLGNLPFLRTDLIPLRWATEPDFITAIAVGQLSPGPTGLWSISLGYLIWGWLGAGLALLASVLPPLLVLVVMIFLTKIEANRFVQDFIRGLTIGVVGLTIGVALGLVKGSINDAWGIGIAIAAAGLAISKRVPVIVILLGAALLGLLIYG